jgi:hypothetical protein
MAIADSSSGERAAAGGSDGDPATGTVAVGTTRIGSFAEPGTRKSTLPAPSAAAVARRIVKAPTRTSRRQGERRWSRGSMPAMGNAVAPGRR